MHTPIDQRQQTVNELGAHPGAAPGEGVGPEDEDGPDHVFWEWLPHTDTVGVDQHLLEAIYLLQGDGRIFQLAHARIEAVDGSSISLQPVIFHVLARLRQARARLGRQKHQRPMVLGCSGRRDHLRRHEAPPV